MRISRLMIGMTGLGALAAAALAAQGPRTFAYDPVPRWTEEPETEEVCKAIAAECGTKFPTGEIDANWGYAEHYDADGYLVGLKTTVSTGCKPLDEHMLLGHRRFRGAFSKDGHRCRAEDRDAERCGPPDQEGRDPGRHGVLK